MFLNWKVDWKAVQIRQGNDFQPQQRNHDQAKSLYLRNGVWGGGGGGVINIIYRTF